MHGWGTRRCVQGGRGAPTCAKRRGKHNFTYLYASVCMPEHSQQLIQVGRVVGTHPHAGLVRLVIARSLSYGAMAHPGGGGGDEATVCGAEDSDTLLEHGETV